jgi:hypothetical protein
MRNPIRTMLAFFSLLTIASNIPAADLVTPAGLNPGDSFRYIFLTTATRNATSGNIADYNTFVQNDATGYTYDGQPITWKAVGSTTTVNARDNVGGFNTNVPVYLVTGTKIADDLTTNAGGLWGGSIFATISYSIAGSSLPANYVWAGTNPDGTSLLNGPGGDVTLGQAGVSLGGTGSLTASAWIYSNFSASNNLYPMYGLSQALTVPVPEPSTWALGTIASATVAWLARRRKNLARA